MLHDIPRDGKTVSAVEKKREFAAAKERRTSAARSKHLPNARTPDCLPDPWLIDSEYLLGELTRIRGLVLQIPANLSTYQPTNTVVDALWRLEGDVRFLLNLHGERQRAFRRKAAAIAAEAPPTASLTAFRSVG